MSNIITASIEFYFKGKKFSPSIEMDLDQYLSTSGCLPDFYHLLANANNIDLYSYEYEMMQAEPVVFSNAKGMVADYLIDGNLDMNAFLTAFMQQKIIAQLEFIADKNMHIKNLQQHPDLLQSLLDAYQLGESSYKIDK